MRSVRGLAPRPFQPRLSVLTSALRQPRPARRPAMLPCCAGLLGVCSHDSSSRRQRRGRQRGGSGGRHGGHDRLVQEVHHAQGGGHLEVRGQGSRVEAAQALAAQHLAQAVDGAAVQDRPAGQALYRGAGGAREGMGLAKSTPGCAAALTGLPERRQVGGAVQQSG